MPEVYTHMGQKVNLWVPKGCVSPISKCRHYLPSHDAGGIIADCMSACKEERYDRAGSTVGRVRH